MYHTFRQFCPDSLRVWTWGPLDLPKTVDGIKGIPEQGSGIPEDRMHECFQPKFAPNCCERSWAENGGGEAE